jgi:hypothetical protein
LGPPKEVPQHNRVAAIAASGLRRCFIRTLPWRNVSAMPDQPHPFSKLAEELVGEFRGIPTEEPRRSVKRATQPLHAVIEQLLQKHQIGRSSPEQTIRDQWPALVGAANASYSHPARIERNRLIVLAAHSVVRNELFLHREEIVARIRKLPGCGIVKSLNLRAG